MKRKISILTFLIAGLLAAGTVSGQGHEDLYRYSDQSFSFGTARSAAMGGAFSSLGADLSSMAINPAGLGMYRRSEIGFTLGYTHLTTKTNHQDLAAFSNSEKQGRFALNNIGAAFNVYNGSGALTSMTFGFNYSKMIDHNSRTRVRGLSPYSMTDLFVHQLNTAKNGNPLTPNEVENLFENGGYAGILGAVLGWESLLIDDYENGKFHLGSTLSPDAVLSSEMYKKTTGSTGQYDISLGMNFGNKIYLGLGFGFQDIYYKENYEYNEYNEGGPTVDYQMDNFLYRTHMKQTGSAWNFKIGTIIRPVEELRIGLAFHTPTYINIDETYYGSMDTYLYNNAHYGESSTVFYGSYNIRTPMRFIGGVSYTFFNTAILSIDYERVWYNQMKLFWDGQGSGEEKGITNDVKEFYQPANNLRVGIETMVAPNWFVRIGFAYNGKIYKDGYLGDFKKQDGSRRHYTAGFGYRNGNFGIDLAYIYADSKDAHYVYDYYEVDENNNFLGGTNAYKADRQRHNISLTTSWRF